MFGSISSNKLYKQKCINSPNINYCFQFEIIVFRISINARGACDKRYSGLEKPSAYEKNDEQKYVQRKNFNLLRIVIAYK